MWYIDIIEYYYKKEEKENSVILSNMDKTWEHYSKSSKPVTGRQILRDPTLHELSKLVKFIKSELNDDWQGLGGGEMGSY